jgi:ACT domain-containing protein
MKAPSAWVRYPILSAAPELRNPTVSTGSTRMVVTIIGKVAKLMGKDRIGIVVKIATILAGANADIVDISHSTLKDFFYLIVLADLHKTTVPFDKLQDRLDEAGRSLGMRVDVQHEDLFRPS